MKGFFRFMIHRICATVAGVFVIFLLVPTVLLLTLPFILFRKVIFSLASFFRPDLGKMVTSGSNFANLAQLYKSGRGKMAITFIMKGRVSIDSLKMAVESLLSSTHPKTGELQYPEMFQTVTQWVGYSFWKPVTNFNLDDHVCYALEGSPVSHEQVMRFIKDETLTPFRKDRPVWKMQFIPDYIPEDKSLYVEPNQKYSVLLLTAEHILADGFSVTKFMTKLSPMHNMQQIKTPDALSNRNGGVNLIRSVTVLATLPLDVGIWLLDIIFGEKKVWNERRDNDRQLELEQVVCEDGTDHSRLVQEDGLALQAAPAADFEEIRSIGKLHGVSTVSVIIAATVGALEQANVLNQDSRLDKLQYYSPIPLSGHPDKLRNHLTVAVLSIPIKDTDPISRLKKIDKYLKNTKQSTLPMFLHLAQLLIGCLPTYIVFRFHRLSLSNPTVLLPTFPGPKDELDLVSEDCVIKEISLMGSVSLHSKIILLSLINFGGRYRLVAAGDTSVLTEHQAQRVCQGFKETLNLMKKSPH